ncbi:hypothetical protein L7F22_062938 [Adiantum nelumboides]|nr:hypothetical protein [Adiantum nelumboides]
MNDLLCKSHIKGTNYVNLRRENMKDLEMGDVPDASENSSLKDFFGDVHIIQSDMDKAKHLLLKIQAANEEGKTIFKAQAMKRLRQRMDDDMVEATQKAKSIKANLEELDKSNLINRSSSGCESGTPVNRTRILITNALRKKLKDLMEEFQVLRHRILTDHKETVERRFYMVTGQHPDEDTVEQIIKTGESENFLQTFIHEQGKGQVMDTIRELQESMMLQKKLNRCYSIFTRYFWICL